MAEATAGESHALPRYRCRKVKAFSPDGNLDKAVWKSVRPVKLVSATGKPQRLQPTTLRACWSDTHLYVGFRCVDSEIRSTFTRRDEPLYEQDVVEAFLCPSGDLHRYFELEFSPNGVIWDGKVVNPNFRGEGIVADTAWDCAILECVVRRDGYVGNRGNPGAWWSVEVAIPFAGLDVETPAVGAEWRANFYRIEYATPTEFSAWSPTLVNPASYHVPPRFGHLIFVGGTV